MCPGVWIATSFEIADLQIIAIAKLVMWKLILEVLTLIVTTEPEFGPGCLR